MVPLGSDSETSKAGEGDAAGMARTSRGRAAAGTARAGTRSSVPRLGGFGGIQELGRGPGASGGGQVLLPSVEASTLDLAGGRRWLGLRPWRLRGRQGGEPEVDGASSVEAGAGPWAVKGGNR